MPRGVYDRFKRIRPIEDRLKAKTSINKKTGCWEWTGARGDFGHGQLYRGGILSGGRRLLSAHRVAWELKNGPILDGLCVLHKCDVPWCINPEHLFLGTKADNSKDMVKKNRQKKGEQLPQSKLTVAQIDAIRKCQLTNAEIAALCGVSNSAISMIKSGKSWRSKPLSAKS